MRNKLAFYLAVSLGAVLWAGCATGNRLVPKSKLEIKDPEGKSYLLELPKDMEAKSITITRGDASFEIKDIKVRTSPEVIGASGTAQADAFKAGGDLMREGFNLGLEAAKKGVTGQ